MPGGTLVGQHRHDGGLDLLYVVDETDAALTRQHPGGEFHSHTQGGTLPGVLAELKERP